MVPPMITTKMMVRDTARPAPRPHAQYKQDLLARIEAVSPTSILDVGCGDGELLRSAAESGIQRCVGIEIEPDAVANLKADGLDVHLGRAERLEFPDRSFDVVVFEYVAHHIEHLERALLEAIRVACKAVIVLDPWYDLSFESQRVAYDFDLWLKRIDRRMGMIHDPSITAAQVANPFRGRDDWHLDCRHRLILLSIPLDTIEEKAKSQLGAISSSRHIEDALETLLDRAREHGLSDDGAILFVASRDGEQLRSSA